MGSLQTRAPTADQQQRLHRFVGRLQQALTLRELSNVVIDGITEVIPADKSALYRLDADSRKVLDVHADADHWFLDEYEAYCREEDPLLSYVVDIGRPIDSTRVVAGEHWKNTPNYVLLRRAGLSYSLEAPVMASGMLLGTMNFARSEEAGAFSSSELTVATLMSEQLAFALERAARFEVSGRRASLMENVLDRLSEAVVVTDLDARVLFRNRAARKDPSLAGRSQPDVPGEGQVFEELLSTAMEDFRLNGKRVRIGRMRGENGKQRVVKSYRLGESHGAAVTMVFDEGADPGSPALPAWNVLTKREQEIARLVAEGLTAKEISERAYITENTVKQHLKRLFAKTDSRNRAELVQRIWMAGRAG
ncbi:MAG: GAF domain-containing protein [Candidatus Leucobacter sulfamidivorax]|nr:GAF domain-containing protein [Candidatus Leucobacter sulfamidivorax]